MSSHPTESLTLRPDPRSWGLSAAAYAVEQTARDRDRRARFRAQLGLPTDGLIVMSGHQAELWHPGILAKWFAMHAVVRQLRARGLVAHAAWVVVDQDANQPWNINYPTRENDALRTSTWKLRVGTSEVRPLAETPTSQLPPLHAEPTDFTRSPSGPQLTELSRLLTEHAKAPSLAAQLTNVHAAILREWTEPATIINATQLAGTTLMSNLVKWMGADASACVLAYNAAAVTEPEANVRPLLVNENTGRIELPLWRLPAAKPRTHVYASELATIPQQELAPRALLMTALLRIAACDLFIHGLGGEKYEQVTDRWLASWLPVERPAPVAVASATRFIPGLAGDSLPPTPEAIDHAVWLAEHARNDPAAAGDPAGAARKQALLKELREARDYRVKKDAFNRMRLELQASATANAARLAELKQAADALRARAAESAVVFNRAWPFAIYPKDVIARLKRDVDAAFV